MGLGPGEVRFRNTGPGYLLGRKKLAAERLLPSEQLKSTALCCVHLTRSMLTWYLKVLETEAGISSGVPSAPRLYQRFSFAQAPAYACLGLGLGLG